jgi:CAAX protease family protein
MMFYVLTLFIIYLFLVEPIAEHWAFNRHKASGLASSKVKMYKNALYRNIFLLACVVVYCGYFHIPATAFGMRPVSIAAVSGYPAFILIPSLGYGLFYFAYLYAPIILSYFDADVERSVRQKMDAYRDILPETSRDRCYWAINSLMSVIEEIIYRGFLLFYLPGLFPHIPILFFIALSLTGDAIRYVTRPNALWYVVLTSTTFVISSLLFNSLYPAIILHILQDLRILVMPNPFNLRVKQSNAKEAI